MKFYTCIFLFYSLFFSHLFLQYFFLKSIKKVPFRRLFFFLSFLWFFLCVSRHFTASKSSSPNIHHRTLLGRFAQCYLFRLLRLRKTQEKQGQLTRAHLLRRYDTDVGEHLGPSRILCKTAETSTHSQTNSHARGHTYEAHKCAPTKCPFRRNSNKCSYH